MTPSLLHLLFYCPLIVTIDNGILFYSIFDTAVAIVDILHLLSPPDAVFGVAS